MKLFYLVVVIGSVLCIYFYEKDKFMMIIILIVNMLKFDLMNVLFSDVIFWLKEGWGLFKKVLFKFFLFMMLFVIVFGVV